jgi:tetratricopeptide (TPR) repeat protein
MFFPRLRRQAKWMFVFLVLVFGLGFVVFGVGSGGGLGLGDLIQNLGTPSGGPSVKSSQKKINKGDFTAYKQLAEAYRAQNNQDQAIAAGEQYVKARPKDYDFIRSLASDYEGKATKLRADAQAIQDELNTTTGGGLFSLPQNSPLGQALGNGRIDQELTTYANQKLSDDYAGMQSSYGRAATLYQRVAAVQPNDTLLQLLLAQSAYQGGKAPLAIKAYQRVITLAPDSAEAQQARQQLSFIISQQRKATNVPSG